MAHELNGLGKVPHANGTLARAVCVRLSEAKIDPEPLLKKAGLTLKQIEVRGARLVAQRQIRFIDLAAEALQDDFLGFHLMRDTDLREMGMLYYVLASSDVLGVALQRGARYCTIANEGLAMTYRDGMEITMTLSYVGVARHEDRQQMEAFSAAVVRLARALSGLNLSPIRVSFKHHRTSVLPEFDRFFGCSVAFGAHDDQVVFAKEIKDLPVVTADSYLNEILTTYCDEALAHRGTQMSALRTKIENTIVPLLPHQKVRATDISRSLGMSHRTLARRLASEHLTFAEVLTDLRRDLANRYLHEEDLSVSRVAWLLGYEEISAFTHAYKRWTGKTPRQVRMETPR